MSRLALEKHCWAEIDLTALRSNFEYIHRAVGGDICAVVKADAYGHGDTTIAHVLQQAGAAAFAVSSLGEGRHLRRSGITKPILILGFADPSYAAVLAENDIATACFSTEYAQALSAAAVKAGVQAKVHLKIDTGMGRIGFAGLMKLSTSWKPCTPCRGWISAACSSILPWRTATPLRTPPTPTSSMRCLPGW